MSKNIVHKNDRFDGVLIDVAQQDVPVEDFAEVLKDAMVEWTENGKKGVWVTISAEKCSVIPQLVQLGLDFHHAQPGYVCMTKWLPQNTPSTLPGYANHYVGVAGFVVNSSNQVLAIQEKYHVRNNINIWKLPGGLADPGEDLKDTALREVYEETGVRCEFVCLLATRHLHNYRHGCSDLYNVCLLRPLTQEIRHCPHEIAACVWMDLDEYESSGLSDINKYFVEVYRSYLKTNIAIGVRQVISYDGISLNNVYSGCKIGENNESERSSGGGSVQNS